MSKILGWYNLKAKGGDYLPMLHLMRDTDVSYDGVPVYKTLCGVKRNSPGRLIYSADIRPVQSSVLCKKCQEIFVELETESKYEEKEIAGR